MGKNWPKAIAHRKPGNDRFVEMAAKSIAVPPRYGSGLNVHQGSVAQPRTRRTDRVTPSSLTAFT